MKRIIAVLSVVALLAVLAACGGKAPVPIAEESTSAAETTEATTEAIRGYAKELDAFNVIRPDDWCHLIYQDDSNRIEMYKTANATDITGDTPMVKIIVNQEEATLESVQHETKSLLLIDGAKQGKNVKINGHDFTFVSYVSKVNDQKRGYFVYNGLVGNQLVTITLRGISPKDKQVQAIFNSIEFKI